MKDILSIMINVRSIRTVYYLLVCSFFCLVVIGKAQAEPQWLENVGDRWDGWKKRAQIGFEDQLIGWHYYWKDGFCIDSNEKALKLRFNGRALLDGGYIGADDELKSAFPDLVGGKIELRDLRLTMFGMLYDWMEFKFSVDFANVRDVKDQWIRFTKIPYIGQITLGHMKESFRVEMWESITRSAC